MIWPLLGLVAIALLGAATVPIMLLTMARFGLFEPIEIEMFGRTWKFKPRK